MKSQYILNAFPNLAIICTNTEGKIIESNQKAKTILANDLEAKSLFLDLLDRKSLEDDKIIDTFQDLLKILKKQGSYLQIIPFKHKTGTAIRLKVERQEIENDQAEIVAHLFTLHLIEESHNFYQFTTELSHDIISVHNPSGKREFVSASVERILGYSKEEVLKWTLLQNIHAEDIDKVKGLINKALTNQEKEWTATYRIMHRNGHYVWLEVQANYFYETTGHVAEVVVILKDISERKVYEQAIEQNHKFIQSIANTIPHIIYVYDFEHQKLIYLNYAIKQVLGYNLEETQTNKGFFLKELIKDSYHEQFEKHYETLIETTAKENQIFQNTYQFRHQNGNYYWFLVNETIFDFDKSGKPRQIIGVIQNIHQEKIAQYNLESQKELLEKILDNLPIGIFIKNQEGKYLFMNQEVLSENGYKRKDILHKTDAELFEAKKVSNYLKTDKITKQKGVHTWEENTDNQHNLIGKKLIHLDQENKDAILGYSLDISEQKNAEKEIVEQRSFVKAFAQATPDDLFVFDFQKYKYIYSNHEIIDSLGYTTKEIENMGKQKALSIIHPEDRDKFVVHRENIQNAQQNLYELSYRVKHKDGEYRHVHSRIIPYIFSKTGKLQTIIGTLQDITAQKRLIEALNEIKQRQELASQAGNVGIWDWDIKQNIVHIDVRLKEMLSYQEGDIGETWEDWLETVYEPDRSNVYKSIQYCFDHHEETYQLEQRHVGKNGKRKWFLTQGRLYWDENHEPHRMIGTSTDITRLKQAETRLIRAKSEAEQATRAKSQFLSTMSHEIRTPMNAVIGMTNLLLQKNPLPNQIKYLDTLKFSAENLLVLINDILDFTKIESGMVVLEKVNFRLKDFLSNIEKSHKQKAKEKNIKLIFLVSSDLPEFVIADPIRISQILNNLLSNAIKFTQKGQVKLEIFLENENEKTADIYFAVSDTGIGIAPELQDKVFESFTQASSDTTRKFGGTGLGLAITKQLLELQDSEIFLNSKPNQGSTFSFSLKLEKLKQDKKVANLQDNNSKKLEETNHTLLNIKALLVEDNEVNQFLATEFLTMWGVEIEYAMNGKEAVVQVSKNDYDLILMDLQMPIMDGYTAAKEIRKLDDSKYQELPIIALTAEVMPDTFEKVQESQMNDYIGKPFQPQELYKKIKKYVNKESEEVSLKLPEHIDAVTQQDKNTGKKLAKLMILLFEELRDKYSLAMENKNLDDLRFINHKAKSSIKILNLMKLETMIEEGKSLLIEDAEISIIQNSIKKVEAYCEKILQELQNIAEN